jgi:hypothetical protein
MVDGVAAVAALDLDGAAAERECLNALDDVVGHGGIIGGSAGDGRSPGLPEGWRSSLRRR